MSEFQNLKVTRWVSHVIFAGRMPNESLKPPRVSHQLHSLNDDVSETLHARLIDTLGNGSRGIVLDIAKDGPGSTFQQCVSLIRCPDNEFLQCSQSLANSLTHAQLSTNAPGGVIVLLSGTTGPSSLPFVAVIKGEYDRGFTSGDDESGSEARHFRYLFMTKAQRLVKVGLFLEKEQPMNGVPPVASQYQAFVFDHNISSRTSSRLPGYFHETFLGCAVPNDAKNMTRTFYDITRNFIDSANVDPEIKIILNHHLWSYMQTQDDTFEASEFAERYLPDDGLRDAYVEHLDNKQFPDRPVAKDTSYVTDKLKRRRVVFDSDIAITGPAGEFPTLVHVEKYEEHSDTTLLRIRGNLKRQI